jgi:hypothetical protein
MSFGSCHGARDNLHERRGTSAAYIDAGAPQHAEETCQFWVAEPGGVLSGGGGPGR